MELTNEILSAIATDFNMPDEEMEMQDVEGAGAYDEIRDSLNEENQTD